MRCDRSSWKNQMGREGGFTLVELMVVIAIVCVLVVMLLPGLRQARLTAQGVSCLSRLRQMGVFVEIYRADYNMYYPMARHIGFGFNWLTQMGPYVFPGYAAYTGGNAGGQALPWHHQTMSSQNFLLCPSSPHRGGSVAADIYPYAHIDAWRVYNYGISTQFGAYMGGVDPQMDVRGGPRREFFADASRIPLVGELKGSVMWWGRNAVGANHYATEEATRSGFFPHVGGGTANYLFLDSHAANVGTSQQVVEQIAQGQLNFSSKHDGSHWSP